MKHWIVLVGDAPAKVEKGNRTAKPADMIADVTRYRHERTAVTVVENLTAFRLAADPVYTTVLIDDDEIAKRIGSAKAARTAGMSEATALRLELAGARAMRSLAPYDLEAGGVVRHVSVQDAEDRLARALIAVESAPPHVRRWL